MSPRLSLILTLTCLAGVVGFLGHEQSGGRFQPVDEWFLDFLTANARESFEKTEPGNAVVLIEMREDEKAEYAAWPPPPLDWQTLLKGLQEYEPEVVVVAMPLNWGRPAPDFAPAVAEALLPFPSVILGVESQLAEKDSTAPAFLGDLENGMPRFRLVGGDLTAMPRLSALITAPDPVVRGSSELGLLSLREVEGEWRLPYALRDRDTLIPTVLAQALSRYSLTPYATGHRLRLGRGAGAYLEGGLFVPLDVSGEVVVEKGDTVPVVNALQLMAGSLADATSEAERDQLGKAGILIIGTTTAQPGQPPSMAALYARALNRLLSLPRLRTLEEKEQWIVWGLAALAATWTVRRVRRKHALKAGAALILGALLAGLLLFQATLFWCPPTVPIALMAAGALLGRLLGRKDPQPEEVESPIPPAEVPPGP